ncbi:hypothetical protein C8R43DRAFT_338945 [Mycena crocata]|nr:hypothetical protein C8R43DRAFT_338945 [Mycena crocata]
MPLSVSAPSDSVPLAAEFLNIIAWASGLISGHFWSSGTTPIPFRIRVSSPSASGIGPFLGITFFEEVSEPLTRIFRPFVGFLCRNPIGIYQFRLSEKSLSRTLRSPRPSELSTWFGSLPHYHDSAGVQLLPSVFFGDLIKLFSASFLTCGTVVNSDNVPVDSVGLRQSRSTGIPT